MLSSKIMKNPSEHPLFTGSNLIHLIIPFIAGFIMSLLVGMLDTAMVSTVGEDAISGVSLVDNLMQVVVFVFMAFGTGGAVVAGQYLGSKDTEQACASTEQLIFMAAVVSTMATVLVFFFRGAMLRLFFGDITPEVSREANIYFVITLFSLPAMALYEACLASFRAMGAAKTTMYISLVMNLINVIGNAILIFIFKIGTAGVAWPTLISRWVGALIGLFLLLDANKPLHLRIRQGFHLHADLITKILKVGLPNGVENGIFQLGKLITVSIIAGFGTQAIAANAVAVILTNLISVPGWGINQTTMTVISRCVGAGDYEQAKYYKKLLILITSATILVWASIVVIGLPWILRLFSLSPEAITLTRWMVICHALGSIIIWEPAFMTPTALRAAGDASFAMVVSIISMWTFRVGLAWVLSHVAGATAVVVWIAMDADWLFRALVYEVYWRRGRWMTKRIV